VDAYASPLLSLPGAVEAEGPDAGVAAHYGDPMREQRELSLSNGFVDLSHRGVVTITGVDRLEWLHSLTTQDVAALLPSTSTEALLLSPHGHVEHHLRLVDDGTSTWITVEPGTATGLVEFLERMRFLMRVEVADVSADWAVVFEPLDSPHPSLTSVVTRLGRETLVPRENLPKYAESAAFAAGVLAYEALRIAAYEPRLGVDTDHRAIPNELGWVPGAVHLDKGCYRGQETVARVHTLGRPPRRLVMLHLDGSVERLPAHGTSVFLEGADVGLVGSAARHFELGPIALALVKRNVPVDAVLTADGIAAAQEVIVHPDAGLHVRPTLR
jgi:tRNA-modifying protein YgfZ